MLFIRIGLGLLTILQDSASGAGKNTLGRFKIGVVPAYGETAQTLTQLQYQCSGYEADRDIHMLQSREPTQMCFQAHSVQSVLYDDDKGDTLNA